MLKKSSTIISEAQALRKKAEDKLKKELNITGSSENGSAVKYLHELQVHQIELELQNEELLNTKEELETAIKRYDDFYDFAPVGYFSFDAKGTILEVNLTGSTMLNLDRSNLVGLKFQKFISKESLNNFTLILMKVFGEKIKGSCEAYITPKEDLSFYAHLQFSAPIAGTKCHAVVTDITETKRVANDLSQTRNYLEQLINYASAPIIVWNPASEIVVFNKSFERLTGFKTQEVINKKLDFLFPDPSQERSKAKIRQTLNGDFLEGIEIPILCKSGDVKIVLWNSANIYDNENRTLISTIAQGNDITSRKKAENALLESQRKLELALENGNIGIWEFDVRTKKFLFDGRMNKMISLGNSPFDRSFKAFERLIKDEDVKHVNEAFRRTVVDHEPFESILRVMSDEGGEKYLIFKGKLYEDEGEPSRIIGVSFD
ncbi:MAG: PAS domain S-box protein, partial [Bacteroidales bacterium]